MIAFLEYSLLKHVLLLSNLEMFFFFGRNLEMFWILEFGSSNPRISDYS